MGLEYHLLVILYSQSHKHFNGSVFLLFGFVNSEALHDMMASIDLHKVVMAHSREIPRKVPREVLLGRCLPIQLIVKFW